MAKWSRNKVNSENINNGNEYDKNSQVALQELNAMVNSGLYSQDFAEHLTDQPEVIENGGSLNIEFVNNPNGTTDKPYKKLRFSNIKGSTGATGNGIASIEKTSTSGLTDTYTITFTNGNTTTFNVENGDEIEMRVSGGYFQYKYVHGTIWYNIISVADVMSIDSELSDTSTNAVRNSTITKKLTEIENKLPIGLPIGSIISSTIPLTDASVRLLDGSTISMDGIYAEFCTYLNSLLTKYPNIFYTNLTDRDNDISNTNNAGKFFIDTVNRLVYLPRITRFIQGLSSIEDIGMSLEAGLPNIEGKIGIRHAIDKGTSIVETGSGSLKGSLQNSGTAWGNGINISSSSIQNDLITLDASKSNSIYGNSNTVQPQATQYPYYIVLANSYKTDIEINIDNAIGEINKVANELAILEGLVYDNMDSISTIQTNLPKKLEIEQQYMANNVGYIKFTNGLLLQWGFVANGTSQVTLPLAYRTGESYVALATGLADGAYSRVNTSRHDRQHFGITTRYQGNTYSEPANWFTVGTT